jgi:KaiC/GvpD/RAD55 family RecA-like ATPase
MNNLKFDNGEKEKLLAEANSYKLTVSRFEFINSHKGLRPNSRHVLLGTSGTGKSTLTRSIILDSCRNHNVLLYSTEENLNDVKTLLAMRDVTNEEISNLNFLYEDDILSKCKKDLNEWKRIVGVKILNSKSEILFIDNITTSDFYTGVDYNFAISFLNAIDDLMREFNLAVFIVAHTKKGIKDDQQSLITGDDVMGPMTLTNKSPYLYIYQLILGQSEGSSTPTFPIIRVKKSRISGSPNAVYLLKYDHQRKEYISDSEIQYKLFSEIYEKRIKLGSKR